MRFMDRMPMLPCRWRHGRNLAAWFEGSVEDQFFERAFGHVVYAGRVPPVLDVSRRAGLLEDYVLARLAQ